MRSMDASLTPLRGDGQATVVLSPSPLCPILANQSEKSFWEVVLGSRFALPIIPEQNQVPCHIAKDLTGYCGMVSSPDAIR